MWMGINDLCQLYHDTPVMQAVTRAVPAVRVSVKNLQNVFSFDGIYALIVIVIDKPRARRTGGEYDASI